MLRFLTAGESHGKALVGIIEGLPAGLEISEAEINSYLLRRQKNYGRGNRMKKIEKDTASIISGVRNGRTIGSPLTLYIENKDWLKRKDIKSRIKKIPRPGHADLAGLIKYGLDDIQDVIERASARETAMRTAIGAVAILFLKKFGVNINGHTISIGKVSYTPDISSIEDIRKEIDKSPVYCIEKRKSRQMCIEIDKAIEKGETLGGTFEVAAINVPSGLGSYVHWDRKIDARLSQAIMSIPSVKAVEIGDGFVNASRIGSAVHDRINMAGGVINRIGNRAGGIEGGVTNGQPVIVRGYAKPIASLRHGLQSVNLGTMENATAPYVRSDTCVVPAISVIAEAMVAWILAEAFLEKFGGDSIAEIENNYHGYINKKYLKSN
jgi:chorismate synthase